MYLRKSRHTTLAARFILAFSTFPFVLMPLRAIALPLDKEIIGRWLKDNGDTLEILENGDARLSFSKVPMYSGTGAIERCTDGGANLCISSTGDAKCAVRYNFNADGNMILQVRNGGPAKFCDALSGKFTREQ